MKSEKYLLKKCVLYSERAIVYKNAFRKGQQMDDKMIIELFFSRDEAAISETDKKYGRKLHTISKNHLFLKIILCIPYCVIMHYSITSSILEDSISSSSIS